MNKPIAYSPICLIACTCLLAGSAMASGPSARKGQRFTGQAHRGRKLDMAYVPPGEFLMGHNPTRSPEEYGPTRRVFTESFWISKNDVTVSQFADYCEATGYKFDWDGRRPAWGWDGKDDRPMVNVTWEEARAFCKWSGGNLPTEAQWEKAARGTDGRNYPWGNEWEPNRAWYRIGNESAAEPSPVGAFPKGASPWGCLDMSGNVAQWCKDWFGPVDAAEVRSPVGPGFGTRKVVRGGSFHHQRNELISWVRSSHPPEEHSEWIGFRVVKEKP